MSRVAHKRSTSPAESKNAAIGALRLVSERGAPRPRGRPRDPNVDAALHDATLSLLAEGGYPKATIEAVAERAGLVRPTVYRRYGSRAALVVATFRAAVASGPQTAPDTGDVDADLETLLERLVKKLTRTRLGRAVQGIVSQVPFDPELAEAVSALQAERRLLFCEVLVRAEQQGRLKPGLDHDSAYDMLAGAIYYRAWFGQKNKIGPEFLKLLVESVLLPRASAR